jgi:hypothetical protein
MNRINEFLDNLTPLALLILALGTYSITRLVVTDTFPLFAKPRDWIKERFPPTDTHRQTKPPRGKYNRQGPNYFVYEGHWLGDLIDCPWCAGWWISLVTLTGFFFQPAITLFVLAPFALRAFVGGYANKIGGG